MQSLASHFSQSFLKPIEAQIQYYNRDMIRRGSGRGEIKKENKKTFPHNFPLSCIYKVPFTRNHLIKKIQSSLKAEKIH